MNLSDLPSLLRASAATLLAAGGVALAAAPPAHAASYFAAGFGYNGASSSDGWSALVDHGGQGFITAALTGTEAVGYWNLNGGRSVFAAPNHTTFRFDAPSGTTIAQVGWAQETTGLMGGDWNLLVSDDSHLLTSNVPAGNGTSVRYENASGSSLYMRLQCGGPHACSASENATFKISQIQVSLTDARSPDPTSPSGALTGAKLIGSAPLTFRAADVGSGLRYVRFYSDGREVSKALVDGNDAHCATLYANDGRLMYDRRVPCVLSATVSAALDTVQLEDGNHTIKATIEDAAGNTSTVLGPETKFIANHPPANTAIPRIDKTELSFDAFAAPRVGQPVTFSSAGSWSGPNLTVQHAWFRCGSGSERCDQIPGSDELTYVPTAADVGSTLRLGSTATNVAGTATVYSLPSGEVIAPKSAGDVIDKPSNGSNGGNGSNGSNGSNGASGSNGAATTPTLPGLPAAIITNNETHTLIGRVVGQERGVACPGDRATLRFEHVSGGSVRLRHGRASAAQLELTCTATGKAIADAKLAIATKTGAQPTVAADVSTDGAGHAVIALAKGASRGITVGYRMYSDDVIARATATLKVLVDASVSIKANHKHLHNGQAVTLRGALAGGLVPKRGVTLAVQWRDGHRWRPFAQIKTNKSGKYAYAYRFTRTSRTVVYHLRVQIAGGQIDYPYVAVPSKSVKVTVGR